MTRNPKKYRQEKKILLIIAVLILAAVICRLFSRFDVVDDALNGPLFERLVGRFTAAKQPLTALALPNVLLEHQPGPDAKIDRAVLVALARDLHRAVGQVQVFHG